MVTPRSLMMLSGSGARELSWCHFHLKRCVLLVDGLLFDCCSFMLQKKSVAFYLSVWVLDDMATRYGWLAVSAIWYLLFEWWRTTSAKLSQGVGSLEIRHLEWTCTNWRGEKELRSSSFHDKSSILERMDTT